MNQSFLRRILGAALAAAALAGGGAQAQSYPSQPVRIIVGFAAGGATDQIARLLAKELQGTLGQPFVVENRPGAGGNLAHTAVARAPADGHTLLFTSAPLTINPSIYKDLPYDARKDFSPVTLVATVPSVLLVPSSSKLRSVGDLVREAKERPGRLNYGSAGNGTPQHLAMELLKSLAGLDIVHVAYKGGAPAVADLIAGQTDLMFAAFPEAVGHMQSGRLRALGISTPERFDRAPDLPTIAEAGVTGFEAVGWQGLLGPAGMPPATVEKLHAAVAEAMARPELKSRLQNMGLHVSGAGPAEFRRFMEREIEKWKEVATRAGARVE